MDGRIQCFDSHTCFVPTARVGCTWSHTLWTQWGAMERARLTVMPTISAAATILAGFRDANQCCCHHSCWFQRCHLIFPPIVRSLVCFSPRSSSNCALLSRVAVRPFLPRSAVPFLTRFTAPFLPLPPTSPLPPLRLYHHLIPPETPRITDCVAPISGTWLRAGR